MAQRKPSRRATGGKRSGKTSPRARRKSTPPAPRWLKKLREIESQQFSELMARRRIAEAVLKRHRDRLMSNPAVTGVHVGYRRRKGQIVYPLQVTLRVHLGVAKRDVGDPRIAHPVESNIEGVPVDVLTRTYSLIGEPTSGEIRRGRTAASEQTGPDDPMNPLIGGISLARKDASAYGTLGLPAYCGPQQVFITNAHVVGPSGSDAHVIQPARPESDLIGNVAQSVRNSQVDLAIVNSNFLRPAKVRVRDLAGGVGPDDIDSGYVNLMLEAFKIGAKTESLQWGRVQADDASVFIEGFGRMDNQIIVHPISSTSPIIQNGDSGAVLLQRIGPKRLIVSGVCHAAGSDGSLIAFHWGHLERDYGVRLYP